MRRQRAAWARRWEEMGVRIEGDPDLQRAVDFALFHLDSSIAPGARQAPLGPRGLSGPSYRGHVFWDSEVFVLPFFVIPIGVFTGVLTGNRTLLLILGPTLILYGIYTVYLLVRRPEELAATENHPSWTHMYRMMMVAQLGFGVAYLF